MTLQRNLVSVVGRIGAALTLLALLSACKTTGEMRAASRPGACDGTRFLQRIACASAAPVQVTGSTGEPEAPAAPEPASVSAVAARPVAPPRSGNGLVIPPFLRDGADITAAIPPRQAPEPVAAKEPPRSVSLVQAATEAVLSHPEVRMAEARVREAKAGIDMARSAQLPQGDIRLATGGSQGGNSSGLHVFDRANPDANARLDATVTLRQLLYDFGATRADIDRTTYLKDAEQLKLLDKIDDIVFRTSQAYLKVLEQRAHLALVDDTIAHHRRLAGIVQANQREGNGTAADVNRISARLTDMNAIRSDVSLALAGAEEQFYRLTRIRPGKLSPNPVLNHRLPPSPEAAITVMRQGNNRLAAIGATARSLDREIDFQRSSQLPKINLEVDGDTKNYLARNRNRNEVEGRALVTMRYRFLDGGLGSATVDQLHHRRDASLFNLRNEEEQASADVRQAYRAIDSSKRKGRLVAEGVGTSRKVQELYLEQFKAGRRTVFELLDAQMSSFNAKKSEIDSRFEGQRAVYEILRQTGRLAEALAPNTAPRTTTARAH